MGERGVGAGSARGRRARRGAPAASGMLTSLRRRVDVTMPGGGRHAPWGTHRRWRTRAGPLGIARHRACRHRGRRSVGGMWHVAAGAGCRGLTLHSRIGIQLPRGAPEQGGRRELACTRATGARPCQCWPHSKAAGRRPVRGGLIPQPWRRLAPGQEPAGCRGGPARAAVDAPAPAPCGRGARRPRLQGGAPSSAPWARPAGTQAPARCSDNCPGIRQALLADEAPLPAHRVLVGRRAPGPGPAVGGGRVAAWLSSGIDDLGQAAPDDLWLASPAGQLPMSRGSGRAIPPGWGLNGPQSAQGRRRDAADAAMHRAAPPGGSFPWGRRLQRPLPPNSICCQPPLPLDVPARGEHTGGKKEQRMRACGASCAHVPAHPRLPAEAWQSPNTQRVSMQGYMRVNGSSTARPLGQTSS